MASNTGVHLLNVLNLSMKLQSTVRLLEDDATDVCGLVAVERLDLQTGDVTSCWERFSDLGCFTPKPL